jgi:hypothetical protein
LKEKEKRKKKFRTCRRLVLPCPACSLPPVSAFLHTCLNAPITSTFDNFPQSRHTQATRHLTTRSALACSRFSFSASTWTHYQIPHFSNSQNTHTHLHFSNLAEMQLSLSLTHPYIHPSTAYESNFPHLKMNMWRYTSLRRSLVWEEYTDVFQKKHRFNVIIIKFRSKNTPNPTSLPARSSPKSQISART